MNKNKNANNPFHTWTKSLFFRLSVVMILLLIASNIAVVYVSQHYAKLAAKESMQAMNLGMAPYILEHQTSPLISDEGKVNKAPMQDLMMHVMAINPAVEVYLLSAEGKILGHVLEGVDSNELIGDYVNLKAAQSLLQTSTKNIKLPVLGPDPRRFAEGNIISVAPILSRTAKDKLGYLYIVLDGRNKQTISMQFDNSASLQTLWTSMTLATFAGVIILFFVSFKLTYPLKKLTQEVLVMRIDESSNLQVVHEDKAINSNEISILENAIQSLKIRVDEQFKRIQETDHMRRELISNISHDLRTPLSSIQGYVETLLIKEQTLNSTQRTEYLNIALRQLQRMDKRVLELFELAKLDSGRIVPKHEPFCMAELLSDVVQGYQLQAQQAQIQLQLDVNEKVNVNADIALIERVLQNLIENALRYTPQGGQIVVGLETNQQQTRVSIKDTGIGIDELHLQHIFERYWRANETENKNQTGAGLGLAIVKRILDLHKTAIQVQSTLHQGTKFTFELPLASAN